MILKTAELGQALAEMEDLPIAIMDWRQKYPADVKRRTGVNVFLISPVTNPNKPGEILPFLPYVALSADDPFTTEHPLRGGSLYK